MGFSQMPGGPSWSYWQGRDGRFDMRGENSRSAKLTGADVAAIKAAPVDGAVGGVSHAALARCYGVSSSAIRRVRQGKTWGVVEPGEWPSEQWNAYIKERPGGEMR